MAQTPRKPRKPSSTTPRRSTPRVAGRGPSTSSTAPISPSTAPSEPSTAPTELSTAPETDSATTESDAAPKPAGKTRPVSRVSTIKPSAATAASSTPAGTGKRFGGLRGPNLRALKPTSGSGAGGFSRRTVAVLAAAAAVLAIFAVIAGLHPGASIGPNKAFVAQSDTTELTSQAQDKVCIAIAANGTDVDAWAAKARAALTGQALDEFNKYLPQQKQILAQTKAVADCRIDALGVSNLSGDGDGATATIVANMIISESQNGQATNSGVPRVQYSMVKKGDNWLISGVDAF